MNYKVSFEKHFTTTQLIVLRLCIKLNQYMMGTKSDNFFLQKQKKKKNFRDFRIIFPL